MSSKTIAPTVGTKETLPIALLALVIALVMQFAGALNINVGIGSIVVFPMVWGLIAGLLVSVQKFKPLGVDLQKAASALVSIAVFLLVARLAFNIGPNLMLFVHAGPALLLQEIGHLLGTVVTALPLAVLLRMGTATIGATFSIDREPSFAMVSEKYGPDSHQYRGVLSMYVFGTLFGAVFITLLTSLVANWKIFDPLALAMGAGVGSGSMMAASAGSIVAAYPEQKDAILAMASVSNLITTMIGVYVGIWVALPLADKFYHFLTRGKDKQETAATGATAQSHRVDESSAEAISDAEASENRKLVTAIQESAATVTVPLSIAIPILTVLGMGTAFIAAKGFSWTIVVGYLVLMALVLAGIGLARLTRRVAAVVWITTIGAYVSSPWFVGGKWLTEQTSIDVLSIATVMLTLAGLSLGKDIPLLRNIGWKIIPVGLVAVTASFLFAVIIAEFSLGFWD
ncbi:MAG: DUF3100 domain-containing protein [Micropruina sp.]|uniref:DUF3100 domain-containing protein n=1 Tax=Micropruina sp. TaxID=2737536 RepID=UPI0039E4DEC2